MNTSIYFLAIRLPACNKVSSGLTIPLHVIGNEKLKDLTASGFGAEEVEKAKFGGDCISLQKRFFAQQGMGLFGRS